MAGNANSGSKRDKIVREALMLAAKRVHEGDPDGRIKLNVAAAKIVELAVEGDLAAFKEIADRIDGKAPQSVDVTTRHEQPITEWTDADLERVIADRSTSRTGVAAKAEGPTKPH
jgi:hypothetical protein